MVKLLICDDEPAVCTLISRFIDCEAHQIALLPFAHDGLHALEVIERERPQLVITDIRMPGLDGIELIREVRERGLDTHFVIVSGYGTFDHARSAIRYQVDDFLVKPISRHGVEEVVTKMCAVIDAQAANQGARSMGDAALSTQKVRAHFISNIIYNAGELQSRDVESVRRDYGLHLRGSDFQVLILKLLPVEKNLRVSEVIKHAEAYMRGILREKCLEYESYIDRERIVILLNHNEGGAEALSNVLDYLFRSMIGMQEFAGFVNMLLLRGMVVHAVRDIPRSFASAERLLPLGIVFGYNKSFTADAHAPEQTVRQAIPPEGRYLERLREIVADGGREELLAYIQSYLRHHRQTVLDDPASLEGIVLGLFAFAGELIPAADDYESRVETAKLEALRDYPTCADIGQLGELLTDGLYKITALYAALMNNRKSLPILKAKEYVEQNFARQITVEEVAGSVFLSPSYFSSLFKQVTGTTFGDYLSEVRIKAAKRYIAGTNHTIAEIGRMAGYLDPKYFSRIFRKSVGLSPVEYRQICAFNMEDGDDAQR